MSIDESLELQVVPITHGLSETFTDFFFGHLDKIKKTIS